MFGYSFLDVDQVLAVSALLAGSRLLIRHLRVERYLAIAKREIRTLPPEVAARKTEKLVDTLLSQIDRPLRTTSFKKSSAEKDRKQ